MTEIQKGFIITHWNKKKFTPRKKIELLRVYDEQFVIEIGCRDVIINLNNSYIRSYTGNHEQTAFIFEDINGKNYLVAFGNMTTSLTESRIEKISNNEFKRQSQVQRNPAITASFSMNERKLNFKPYIDVRGMRTEEAIEKVQELVDEAVMLNVSEVKILHGKGNGILRQMIREYLNTLDFVKSSKDAHIEMGGSGITMVEIE